MNNLSDEQDILRVALDKYNAQDGANQRHIPLELFIEDERERRAPGYKEPLSIEEIVNIANTVKKSESKNPFVSFPAKIKIIALKKNHTR